MAAATAASVTTLDLPPVQSRELETSAAATLAEFGMTSASRRFAVDASPKRPSSSGNSPTKINPIIELAQRRAQRVTNPAAPLIPGRRVFNVDPDANRSDAPSMASSSGQSSATQSSVTPSQSASQAKVPSNLDGARQARPITATPIVVGRNHVSPSRETIEEPSEAFPTPRPRRVKSREASRKPTALTNLEMASLSTPELHLASDPMLDTEEPSFLRRLGRPSPSKAWVSSGSVPKHDHQSNALLHARIRSSEPATNPPPGVGFSSFSAAMNAVETEARPSLPQSYNRDLSGSRPVTSTGPGHCLANPDHGAASPSLWQNNNPSTDTLGPARSAQDETYGDVASSTAALGNANTWFQRQRRWSVNARSPDLKSTSIADTEDSLTQLSSAISGTSLATAGTGTTFFSESELSASTGPTDTSLGVDQVKNLSISLESLRSARAYLIKELAKMTPTEMGEDGIRIANLAWFTREADAEARGVNMDSTREMFEFWKSIADGVLLCVLANRVRPGSVDRIDRRDVEWVKADNISRFLRAARDHVGLRSKDLFQTLDLTDATVEGLLRASHTILTIERVSRRSSHAVPSRYRRGPDDSADSTHHSSLPSTPQSHLQSLESSPDPDGSHQTLSTIQKNRREAERILVSMARPEPLAAEASVKSRRRRSGEAGSSVLPAFKMRGASITFADNVKSSVTSSDEENRMPYRDRRLSESAISLTGVAEEDAEDEGGQVQANPAASRPSVSPVPISGLAGVRRGSSESEKSIKPRTGLLSSSPLARTSSQRRISAELGLGQLPRSVIGSTENLDDYMHPNKGSPSRIPPTRRHSARVQTGSSLLNPSRESLLSLGNTVGTDFEASTNAAPRVPFPRSTLQSSESPGSRRMGRHLSLNAGSNGEAHSVASSSSASLAQPASKYGPRPAYRHMRYTSDLQLPGLQRPPSVGKSPDLSNDDKSFAGSSRARFDSEVGSFYTNTLGSSTHDEGASATTKMSREPSVAPSSKHKLVVVEEGKPNVTYQLGNCIGRGQFGSVYRALNLNSGQMVAVKRIKLDGRSDEDVTQLMNEVDLLKSLTHPSVVKYEGLVRGPEVVSIILEYVENGSLLHTLKAFGNFPEKLVASYVVKILEGLNYLHEQNVVHCDLKAANILTTKNGNVKLSDFGVSLNLQAVEKMNNKNNDAIGTPNWMAPEVIELKGVTTAADIWSLACTIIELLTGKPPYYDMLAMSAMFRIVEDDCPPIPDKCSAPLREMLLQCFNKDPLLRPSAETLFEHEWVRQTWSSHKELRPQDSVPFLRRISADLRKLDPNMFTRDPKNPQTFMERSSSSPPPTLSRPSLTGMRAYTTPAEQDTDLCQTPTSSPRADSIGLANLDEISLAQKLPDGTRSPELSQLSPLGLSPLKDPSMLDLSGLDEQAKPHAFVKSTFSKAVRCKICSEPVKKHAVLCEECGLVCHARCAGHAPSACNLRAQLLMFQARTSMDQPRVTSPTPSFATGTGGQPLSLGLSPPVSPPLPAAATFRFPFAIKRASRSSNAEFPSSALRASSNQHRSDAGSSPPTTPLGGPAIAKSTRDTSSGNNQGLLAPRRRKISLIPGRQRSPSPDPAAHHVLMNGTKNGFHGPRRPSSVSYGSVSGGSSVSSHGGALAVKATKDSSASGQQHQELGLQQKGISTPHLSIHASHDSNVEPTRFRRRLSSGFGFGQSELSLPGVAVARSVSRNTSIRKADKNGLSTGQITPTPGSTEKRKSKRNASKSDCTVM